MTAPDTPGPAQSQVPPTCILTGADGENPDDCTTHDHEGSAQSRAARRERQGRVTVDATVTPEKRAAVVARCARCGSDLSGPNDSLSLAFLLDVGNDHDCT